MGGFSSITGDPLGTVMNADNVSFDGTTRSGVVTVNGQLLIGSTVTPHIRVGAITSPLGTVTIGYSSPNITLDVSGAETAYTNVNHAASPYTVLSTDEYISVDCSAGVVSLLFPNVPTAKRTWVIKDRTGNAAISNISITTVGGVVTIDGQTTIKIISNFGAVNLLANSAPSYEVF